MQEVDQGGYEILAFVSKQSMNGESLEEFILDFEENEVPLQTFQDLICSPPPPYFKAKPRLLLVQACRGHETCAMTTTRKDALPVPSKQNEERPENEGSESSSDDSELEM